jgi:hypothetical protein
VPLASSGVNARNHAGTGQGPSVPGKRIERPCAIWSSKLYRKFIVDGAGSGRGQFPPTMVYPSRSMMVALAMPPPSHMVWRP